MDSPRARSRLRLHPLQIITHVGAWIPLAVLLVDFYTHHLTINPIQAAEQRTGIIGLILLVLSLACTPVYLLFRTPVVLKLARPLGLYGYLYAAFHVMIYIGLDYGFDFGQLWELMIEKPYLWTGLIAFVLVTGLAITSFRWWMVWLGKNWKRLHRLVYLMNLLVVLHFGLSVKGDFFRLMGDVQRPLLALLVVSALLVLRLPAIRRRLAGRFRLHFKGLGSQRRPGSGVQEPIRNQHPGH